MAVSIRADLPLDRSDTGKVKKVALSEVVRWCEATRQQTLVRGADTDAWQVVQTHVLSARLLRSCQFVTVETDDAYRLSCTPDTELLCETSAGVTVWRHAGELSPGMSLVCNGIPDERYQDADWLRRVYVTEGRTQGEIAAICQVSERTIRAYVKKFGLGRGDAGALFGEQNPNYQDEVSRKGGYERSYAEYLKAGTVTGHCSLCHYVGRTQVHHRDHDPTNSDPSNFLELCPLCHKSVHLGYVVRHVRRSRVKAVWQSETADAASLVTEQGNVVIEGFVVRAQ